MLSLRIGYEHFAIEAQKGIQTWIAIPHHVLYLITR
jgi:hypothetical protein